MDLNLGLDIANRKLLSPTGSPLTLPPLVQGDTLNVVLQGMQLLSTGDYALVPIDFATIKLGIGLLNAAPLQGTFKLTVGADTTPPLSYNSSPQFLQAQLNALASVISLGGLTVLSWGAPNIWIILWNSETVTTAPTVASMDLFPYCFSRVMPYQLESTGSAFVLKIFQAPVAFTDAFALPSAPAVTCVQVQAGSGVLSEIQKITVPPNATGEFTLTFGALTTLVIPVADVTAAAIATALNNLFSDGITRFTVIQPGSNYYYVQFVGPLALTTYAAMTVTMISQPPQITPAASLSLNVPGIEVALAGAKSVQMVLEIEINDGEPGTPVQVPVTVNAAMLDSQMALAVSPTWLSQQAEALAAAPSNNPNLAVIGMVGYEDPNVGDTVALQWTITHNIGTRFVLIEVVDNNTNIVLPDSEYTAQILNENQVKITFATTPTENQYTVIISGAFATPYYNNLTLNISNITGLQTALDALSVAGNPLDLWPTVPLASLPSIPFSKLSGLISASQLPTNVCLLDSNSWVPLINMNPAVVRVASDGSLVFSSDGGTSWTQLLTAAGVINPSLLGNLAQVPAFVSAVQAVLAGQGVSVPAGQLIPLQARNEIIGYTGIALTPDPKTGYSNSQITRLAPLLTAPGDFDREVWRLALNDKMLVDGSSVNISWGVSLQLIRPNCAVQYNLVVEIGTYTTSGSYLSIAWNTTTPVFSQAVVLTEEMTIHSFALSISRALVSGVDTFTLAQTLYNKTSVNNPAAPSSANFAVRCRLINLETEGSPSPARAWISYAVVPGTNSPNGTQAQAVISTT